jgi:hypothetical protein
MQRITGSAIGIYVLAAPLAVFNDDGGNNWPAQPIPKVTSLQHGSRADRVTYLSGNLNRSIEVVGLAEHVFLLKIAVIVRGSLILESDVGAMRTYLR